KMRDEDGIWGGARKYQIRLIMDPQIKGKVCHLPNTIHIGEKSGLILYKRMLRLCRRCQAGDHVMASCTAVIYNNCRGQHKMLAFKREICCNLCGTDGHTLRTCPKSYANKTKQVDLCCISDIEELVNQPMREMVSTPKPRGVETLEQDSVENCWVTVGCNHRKGHAQPLETPQELELPNRFQLLDTELDNDSSEGDGGGS
ncbi:ZCHC3 protein, partial [Amia calva]|nr:ZCHC3 protein [Amia calva]